METEQTPKKIVYDILDKVQYSKTYPNITNQTYGAIHEIHIFLLPLNPNSSLIAKAMQLAKEFNEKKVGDVHEYQMKMCFLTLIFRGPGPVKVLQSARYFRSNDQNEVIRQAYIDANYFVANGFDVVRVKIEANANSNLGVPVEDEEAKLYPKYFEFHIKVAHKSAEKVELITDKESDALLTISKNFTQLFQTPVPLSWNNLPNCSNPDNPGFQRFLNVRFRQIGMKKCKEQLDKIKLAITEQTNFKVTKSIDEYVWYDTFTDMDHGWIDFTPKEMEEVLA